jgi:hypothetical protein
MNTKEAVAFNEILTHLRDGEEKSIFSIHYKYRLSPLEIHQALQVLEAEKIIQFMGENVKLINRFDDSVLKKVIKYCITKTPDLNLDFKREKIDPLGINEPYLPNEKLLDLSFFQKNEE